ncbi:MAG: hypothetical protein BJ554DRAFT_1392 [Olpidium bornovanus]|uniref:Uncharacterized protein n=1 Tax=Olpidium bornovanus TaxID=278681 RepID=A0A8H8A1D2_9FUNG|nr:MAG: hypothetical protein BJ554DRAFT_1392 [Olpidium bornovanus]
MVTPGPPRLLQGKIELRERSLERIRVRGLAFGVLGAVVPIRAVGIIEYSRHDLPGRGRPKKKKNRLSPRGSAGRKTTKSAHLPN